MRKSKNKDGYIGGSEIERSECHDTRHREQDDKTERAPECHYTVNVRSGTLVPSVDLKCRSCGHFVLQNPIIIEHDVLDGCGAVADFCNQLRFGWKILEHDVFRAVRKTPTLK
jgi:hypothetical protein